MTRRDNEAERQNGNEAGIMGWIPRFSLYVFCFLFFISTHSFAQQRCAMPQRDSLMQIKYKNWVFQRKVLEDSIGSYLKNRNRARIGAACMPIKIPVVVHVIHDTQSGTIGGALNPNISEAQILNQIRILNEDYRRKTGTRGFNNNPVGTDTGIEFYLAKTDPDGKTTNGITRHYYTNKKSFDIFSDESILADIVSWPSDRYLNIWVVRALNASYLGVSQFPSVNNFSGLDNSGELQDKTDGVIIDFRAFGSGGTVTSRLYNLGRTATHEVGHWLGLLHTWGDDNCGTDFCDDTPTCEGGNQGATCGPIFSNCNGSRTRNMIENYMDYSPDSCMNVFTKNQMDRIYAVFEKSPRRTKLSRLACTQLAFGTSFQVEAYPNPAEGDLNVKVVLRDISNLELSLYSTSGQLIWSYQLESYPSWLFALPTSTLPIGEYILRVKSNDGIITKRIMLNR